MIAKPACCLALACLAGTLLQAQAPMEMPGMSMPEKNAAESFLMSLSSGTSANPASWPMPMLMKDLGSWKAMLMGQAFLVDTQQSGPRGGDKFYSANWLMASAVHRAGENGAFQFELMLSLEPATITDRRYPLLFQTGETAYGKPIVDAQHPHNFVMGLGVTYARTLSKDTTFELYVAPVGDPALGPVAYPHRASAMELPQAPIGHHWQDATHISNDVVTAGLAYSKIRIEASGFHGGEPGENRWAIEQGSMDSWSSRIWFLPAKNWAAQVSTGRLTHPEALEPGDQIRTTASLAYSKPRPGGSWSSTLVWGRNHYTATQRNLNSYLAESEFPLHRKNWITGRAELVDKDELFANDPIVDAQLNRAYGSTFRIGAYTAGYTRDVASFANVTAGLGANVEFYSLPDALKPYYGTHPIGANIFLRLRLVHTP